MAFLDVDVARLFYTDDGRGALPILLVHGYTADSHDWSWQIPHLLERHRVIAVDLRGHGASSAPESGYTTERFARDLIELLDHRGVREFAAIGHSMGGSIVSALAVEHPERVRAVVAVDPAYLVEDELAGALGPTLATIDDTDLVPFVQDVVAGLDSPDTSAALRTWHVRRVASVAPHVLRQTMSAQVGGMARRSESEGYLPRRRCPVLSFHTDPARGRLDEGTFADARSRVVTWPDAGHWLHQERPTELNDIVSAWLASLD